ncbi:diaminopimelate epimerase [Oleiagrimonas citrea]|uniref:Diaminopimelate epimerase n=1 Tax=Oleiagrimonas citrea TaxID=1665687 RepID=A0A846ZQW4_9GAMM|nr:diaminopimelate epimerase [Oleiagrimonas citrea]NKZ40057.1 diaminopimelate epimerase [Oleiagrimonas citrea]
MQLSFTKMHGLGNDFVVLDCRQRPMPLSTQDIRALGHRHTGIGFDQLLSIENAAEHDDCRYAYGIWNRDGEAVGQCGNGVRCVAAWLHREGLLDLDETVRLRSPSGPVTVRLIDALTAAVDMGEPQFEPGAIPFDTPQRAERYPIELDDASLSVGVVSMGNPHAVVEVDDLHAPSLERLGPQLTAHPRFSEGCNAGFATVLDMAHIRLRVHERGSGWTQACGTGACAAMAVLHAQGRVGREVEVRLPGGPLQIAWNGPGHTLWMTGPAAFVFEGKCTLPE